MISIHALLAESDPMVFRCSMGRASFQSTLSLRRATGLAISWIFGSVFQSTLSLRRATVRGHLPAQRHPDFNPRSPCGERLVTLPEPEWSQEISIHALLAESDGGAFPFPPNRSKFQSTLSLRRATGRMGWLR